MARKRKKKGRKRTRKAIRESYKPRAEALLRCGFESYRDYLDSGLWAAIRDRVLERDSWECQCCYRKATQVHHMSYGDSVLMGDCLGLLISLCAKCHRAIEFDHRRRKRHFAETTGALRNRQRYFLRKYAREVRLLREVWGG